MDKNDKLKKNRQIPKKTCPTKTRMAAFTDQMLYRVPFPELENAARVFGIATLANRRKSEYAAQIVQHKEGMNVLNNLIWLADRNKDAISTVHLLSHADRKARGIKLVGSRSAGLCVDVRLYLYVPRSTWLSRTSKSRRIIRLMGRVALFVKIMYEEVCFRPQHSGAKRARLNFEACAAIS